ncbi:MAG: DNA-directed RNA polymerase subunit omega [bacterium]
MSLLFPRADELLKRFPNVYILTLVAARRAKQLEQGAPPLLTVSYLQRKYGTVEKMNEAWGTSFRSFDEVLKHKKLTIALFEILEGLILVGKQK